MIADPSIHDKDPIYLVDDDNDLRSELADALENAGHVVSGFASGETFLAAESELAPGCVVLDLTMPGISGMQVHASLTERKSNHVVVMLTGTGSIATAVSALRKGAIDFVEKPAQLELLKASIETARVRRLAAAASNERLAAAQARFSGCTPRELDVLYGIVLGLSAKMTARRLDLSFRTVESYRANLMAKLNVRSLAEVVRMAIEARIEPEGAILSD